jgi:aquaporin Z
MATSAALLAEFVGTFILVFTVGCNVMTSVSTWAGVSIACSLMVAIYALAPISGANFNPAVSVALGFSKKLSWKDVGLYSMTQVLAGACAGVGYRFLFGAGFSLEPATGFSWWQAGVSELLYTLMLCFVVLNTACSAANAGKHQFYGLSIGFVIVAGAYGAGVVSLGCFNPAVALGIEAGNLSLGGYLPIYIAFELAGAALAAKLYSVVRPEEFEQGQPAGMMAKVTSEILGTYFLVLTVGLNVLGDGEVFSIAASLMCMIFALGDVSGAHFNPAVTAAVWGIGQIDAVDAGVYVCFQLFGGILAALTYSLIYSSQSTAATSLAPGAGYGLSEAAVAEIFYTFVLCFVVLSVACSPSAGKGGYSEVFGLAIGSCVTVGGYAIGAVSGGSLNPAVSVGIASGGILGGEGVGDYSYAAYYSFFELLGAGLAAGTFLSTHAAAGMAK